MTRQILRRTMYQFFFCFFFETIDNVELGKFRNVTQCGSGIWKTDVTRQILRRTMHQFFCYFFFVFFWLETIVLQMIFKQLTPIYGIIVRVYNVSSYLPGLGMSYGTHH